MDGGPRVSRPCPAASGGGRHRRRAMLASSLPRPTITTAAVFLWALFVCLVIPTVSGLAVMSIDLGGEWMKVAVVSPGVPMEIVLNTESQRKTPVAIAFRDGERFIGDTALTVAGRFPEKTFTHFVDLLGKRLDNPAVNTFQKRFPYHKLSWDEAAQSLVLQHPDGQAFTPEELVAMLIERAKTQVESSLGVPEQVVSDVVITVPAFWSQAERRALQRATRLAGLKLLQLINTNTATALNYGVFRRKDFNASQSTNILFYDMGATSVVVTIASYQLVKTKTFGYTETNPQVTIRGLGFDRSVGGFEMQIRLRDHLAHLFAKQHNRKLETVTGNNRALSKLLKEAGRLKKVLSANSEHVAQVENVMDDLDLKAAVSRKDFEALCGDLLDEAVLTDPIEQALKSSGMLLSEMDQVIVVGGNQRTPRVQQVLESYFGRGPLGKSINADEAAALGAAYQAAAHSAGFKVKTFHVRDATMYPITVDFVREDEATGKRKWVSRTLFAHTNPYPQKKVITFNKHTADFEFAVNYGDLSFLPARQVAYVEAANLTSVHVNGVTEAFAKHAADENTEVKGIKAHFNMDDSGILVLDSVEALFEARVEEAVPAAGGGDADEVKGAFGDAMAKIGEGLRSMFSGKDARSSEEGNDTSDSPSGDQQPSQAANGTSQPGSPASSTRQNATNATSAANDSKPVNGTDNEPVMRMEMRLKTIKEKLPTESTQLDVTDPTAESEEASRIKLADLTTKDRLKLLLEKARNSLESYIVDTKDKLYDPEIEAISTDEEREAIRATLVTAGEWVEYESDGSPADAFRTKLTDLKNSFKPLADRLREKREKVERERLERLAREEAERKARLEAEAEEARRKAEEEAEAAAAAAATASSDSTTEPTIVSPEGDVNDDGPPAAAAATPRSDEESSQTVATEDTLQLEATKATPHSPPPPPSHPVHTEM